MQAAGVVKAIIGSNVIEWRLIMAILPMMSDAHIADRTTERSLARGERYYADGLVEAVVWRSGLLTAEVMGSEGEPYVVLVRIGEDGRVKSAECSCPYEFGGDCKHTIATLLYYQANRDSIEQRPAIGDLIVGLDEDKLRLLVLHLVERRPVMMNSAERMISTIL